MSLADGTTRRKISQTECNWHSSAIRSFLGYLYDRRSEIQTTKCHPINCLFVVLGECECQHNAKPLTSRSLKARALFRSFMMVALIDYYWVLRLKSLCVADWSPISPSVTLRFEAHMGWHWFREPGFPDKTRCLVTTQCLDFDDISVACTVLVRSNHCNFVHHMWRV
jgi:hypothetical protein